MNQWRANGKDQEQNCYNTVWMNIPIWCLKMGNLSWT
ncbi:hypothetical protein TcasGA2_TC033972 [Tribolium castaneum]|uniref:Uncharacterized protein n=1 Tax=Tribolium castaneum TaxID=7070 RepID=A0A139WE24_TRICA|nr:hypothetical protein TcasGA2_TC033972 [Tribolium castaneum]